MCFVWLLSTLGENFLILKKKSSIAYLKIDRLVFIEEKKKHSIVSVSCFSFFFRLPQKKVILLPSISEKKFKEQFFGKVK